VPPASAGSRTSRPGRRLYGAVQLTRPGAPIAAGKDEARAASDGLYDRMEEADLGPIQWEEAITTPLTPRWPGPAPAKPERDQ
jgi:hypothetical protein